MVPWWGTPARSPAAVVPTPQECTTALTGEAAIPGSTVKMLSPSGGDDRDLNSLSPDTIQRLPIGPPSRQTKKSRRVMLSGILAVSEGGLEPPRPLIGH